MDANGNDVIEDHNDGNIDMEDDPHMDESSDMEDEVPHIDGICFTDDRDPHREISATGDIILVVGASDSEYQPLRLIVQSAILREASSVFRAMLSPPWIESQGNSAESQKEINLPEDDPEAMEIVCQALHFRSDLMDPYWHEYGGGENMLDVAILIDKYDLKASMKFITDTWFRQFLGCMTEESIYRMAAAWVLEEEEFFAKYTWIVMVTHPGPYAKFLSHEPLRERLPPQIFLLLAERSFNLRIRFLDAITSEAGFGHDNDTKDCKCKWRETLEDRFRCLWNLIKETHTSNQPCSIMKIIEQVTPLADEQKVFQRGWCTLRGCNHNEQSGAWAVTERTTSTIYDRFPEWTERETSLCLRCLRQDDPRGDYRYKTQCEHSKARRLDSPFSAMDLLGK